MQALKAALKAMLINKIGDLFLLGAAGYMCCFSNGSTTISEMSSTVASEAFATEFLFGTFSYADSIAVLLVLAAFVKSAQIGFHTWLPDAMEGPTPVSALLHAATMVTAGVYLVIRFSFVIECSSPAKVLLVVGGFFTIVLSSLIALAQYDIKKIIAYSTCSQLGLMFYACGLSGYDLALFHFFNHAFFKCALFLLAGVIIHELKNEQDVRHMGGLHKVMPITSLCFLIASMSLIGFPGFSGAVSKDAIFMLINYTALHGESIVAGAFLLFTNILMYLTIFYVARLGYYLFYGPVNVRFQDFPLDYVDVVYASRAYRGIFLLLSFMGMMGGKVFRHLFIFTEGHYVNINNDIVVTSNMPALSMLASNYRFMAFLIVLSAVVVIGWAIQYFKAIDIIVLLEYDMDARFIWLSNYLESKLYLREIYICFNKKCHFDEFYNSYIVDPFFKLSVIFEKAFEEGLFKFLVMAARGGTAAV